jgi:hypothetical protein
VTKHLLKFKSEALSHFRAYNDLIRNHTGRDIHTLRTFELYLTSLDTIRQLTAAYSPEQNVTAEKMDDILFNTCRVLLFEANLSKTFWGEACHSAVYIHNRSPSSSIPKKTPYELWTGRKPNVAHFIVFGEVAFSLIPSCKRQKLDPRAQKVLLVGYSTEKPSPSLFPV